VPSPFGCRDDDLSDCLDLFVGHRRKCVNGRVDCLAFGVGQCRAARLGAAAVMLSVRLIAGLGT
jgi:hypothetical protein